MPRIVHDAPGMVYACPECDRAGEVYQRVGGENAYLGDPSAEYVCHDCGATFEAPMERREHVPDYKAAAMQGRYELSKVLADMTIEEFDAIVHGERDAA